MKHTSSSLSLVIFNESPAEPFLFSPAKNQTVIKLLVICHQANPDISSESSGILTYLFLQQLSLT